MTELGILIKFIDIQLDGVIVKYIMLSMNHLYLSSSKTCWLIDLKIDFIQVAMGAVVGAN